MFEDDYLKKSSAFINEMIINSLKDKIIYIYIYTIISDYYYYHHKEFVFIGIYGEEDMKEKDNEKKDL